MILITGGAWQGKLEFAIKLEKKRRLEADSGNQSQDCVIANGKTDSFKAAFESTIIDGLHEYIRRLLKEGESVEEFLLAIKIKNQDAVIITDELGCGIVPVDKEDRNWRERAGRAAAYLAGESKEVYRLVCGIASRIK